MNYNEDAIRNSELNDHLNMISAGENARKLLYSYLRKELTYCIESFIFEINSDTDFKKMYNLYMLIDNYYKYNYKEKEGFLIEINEYFKNIEVCEEEKQYILDDSNKHLEDFLLDLHYPYEISEYIDISIDNDEFMSIANGIYGEIIKEDLIFTFNKLQEKK